VEDRDGLLRKDDLVLVSQQNNEAAELHVLKQGNRMFLARRRGPNQWEPASKTGAINQQPIHVAGHCVGIIWRAL
jgi:hypothetical protein